VAVAFVSNGYIFNPENLGKYFINTFGVIAKFNAFSDGKGQKGQHSHPAGKRLACLLKVFTFDQRIIIFKLPTVGAGFIYVRQTEKPENNNAGRVATGRKGELI
jgi:hypothetical protein